MNGRRSHVHRQRIRRAYGELFQSVLDGIVIHEYGRILEANAISFAPGSEKRTRWCEKDKNPDR